MILRRQSNTSFSLRGKQGPCAEQNPRGDVKLHVNRDASVCNQLVKTGYSAELGARSLHKAVDDLQDRLVEPYLDEEPEIVENAQAKTNYVVDVRGKDVVVRISSSLGIIHWRLGQKSWQWHHLGQVYRLVAFIFSVNFVVFTIPNSTVCRYTLYKYNN